MFARPRASSQKRKRTCANTPVGGAGWGRRWGWGWPWAVLKPASTRACEAFKGRSGGDNNHSGRGSRWTLAKPVAPTRPLVPARRRSLLGGGASEATEATPPPAGQQMKNNAYSTPKQHASEGLEKPQNAKSDEGA